MKTKYKYIHFVKMDGTFPDKNERWIYNIINNSSKTTLGSIFYYYKWKQYVFEQESEGIVFNKSCLLDIIDFINQLSEK